jgi:thiol-disulfide isomerase/thioredoxin
LLLSSVVIFASLAASSAAAEDLHEDFPRASLPNALSGEDQCLEAARGDRATVLLCLATDCPISNEFVPTIVEIAKQYIPRGVAFVGIDPNGADTLEIMSAYARENSIDFPFLKDPGGKISRRLLFSVTPEARVFDRSGRLVYSGRIDDRYRRGGAIDPHVKRDLAEALDEVLAGKPVSASRTKAMGCPIQVVAPATN